MHRNDRSWALKVLGLDEAFTPANLEDAQRELKDLWTPHLESANPTVREQGQQEIDKIDRAVRVLTQHEPSGGLRKSAMVGLLCAAFAAGFGGMYVYRLTHKPQVNVVVPRSLLTSSPQARLDAPDIKISTERVGPMPLTNEEREQINDAIARLRSDDPYSAMNDLESMGERSIPALTEALWSRRDDVRLYATTVLNAIAAGPDGEPNTTEDIYKLRPFFTQAGTVAALSRLTDDPIDDTRENVAYTLGNIGDQSAFGALVRMSSDSHDAVRAAVAHSLGRLNNLDGVPTLTSLLQDSETSVRMAAAAALGTYQDRQARTALRERLSQESDSDVIATIQDALQDPSDPDDGQGV